MQVNVQKVKQIIYNVRATSDEIKQYCLQDTADDFRSIIYSKTKIQSFKRQIIVLHLLNVSMSTLKEIMLNYKKHSTPYQKINHIQDNNNRMDQFKQLEV